MNERARKTIGPSSYTDRRDPSARNANLRRWNTEEYEAIMGNLSGRGGSRRHRRLQGGGGDDFAYSYVGQGGGVTRWQIAALVLTVAATVALGGYACSLRHELSHLNQYLPLGYKLFPESGTVDDDGARVDGVELS